MLALTTAPQVDTTPSMSFSQEKSALTEWYNKWNAAEAANDQAEMDRLDKEYASFVL